MHASWCIGQFWSAWASDKTASVIRRAAPFPFFFRGSRHWATSPPLCNACDLKFRPLFVISGQTRKQKPYNRNVNQRAQASAEELKFVFFLFRLPSRFYFYWHFHSRKLGSAGVPITLVLVVDRSNRLCRLIPHFVIAQLRRMWKLDFTQFLLLFLLQDLGVLMWANSSKRVIVVSRSGHDDVKRFWKRQKQNTWTYTRCK